MVLNAASAGFDGLGLRFDLAPPARGELHELNQVLTDSGLSVLDIEVIRIGNENTHTTAMLLECAVTLGAQAMLVVSDTSERNVTLHRLNELADEAKKLGLIIALEFMPFTAIKDLDQALNIIDTLQRDEVRILADALHMARSGSSINQLRERSHEVCYLQLCDAAAERPQVTDELVREARFGRLMPGDGALDLRGFLQSAPSAPISVEVQSRFLQETMTASELAALAYRKATEALRS
jgi:sugar phosphate isomerase/epimerase